MNKGYSCDKCYRGGFTSRGLQIHKTRKHSYVPPPPPKPPVIIEGSAIIATENHNLSGGRELDVGDVIWIVRKAVILKIEKTQGNATVKVELGITKRNWQCNQPI